MSPTAKDYAGLAKDAYEDRREWVRRPDKGISINGHLYKAVDAQDSPSGFQATAYQRVDTGEIIIAYRGTHGVHDALVDTVMVADKVNPQEADARAFTQRVIEYAKAHGIPLNQVTVTGHSLGGTLAEIEAARFGLRGATFNAYGSVDLGYGVPEGGNRVIDYVVATDVVSAASRHYGELVPLATPEDITVLQASGYMDGHGNVLEVAQARALVAHGIDNFAPERGGASILNPDAAALAKANAVPIAAYDRNVHDTRENLRLVSRFPGTPVWALARNAEVAGTAMTAGGYVVDGLQDAGRFVAQEASAAQHVAERAASAVASTAQHAADAVEHDARAVGQVVESGIRRAGKAVEQAADSVRQTTTQWGEAAGRAAADVRDGFERGASQALQQMESAAARIESALPRLSDPAHPQHAVYAALKARLPPDTSEDRLAQCTAACHAARLDRPEHLGRVYVTKTKALFLNHSLFGQMAEVDLTRPAPPAQDSVRKTGKFDYQQEVQPARFAQPARGAVHLP